MLFAYNGDENCIYVEDEQLWPTTRLGAIVASIEKWQFIRKTVLKQDESVGAGGSGTCALCHLYLGVRRNTGSPTPCANCPLCPLTHGEGYCKHTPFGHYENMEDSYKNVDTLITCVDEGIALLQSLAEIEMEKEKD